MNQPLAFKDMFSFERLIAPTILRIVYWIGLAVITLAALGALFGGMGHMGFIGRLIGVLVGYVLAVIFWRILIEIYIVLFGMYDRLGEIRDRLGGGEAE